MLCHDAGPRGVHKALLHPERAYVTRAYTDQDAAHAVSLFPPNNEVSVHIASEVGKPRLDP